MSEATVFDYPFWEFEILLAWLYRRSGVASDDEAIDELRDRSIPEISQRAAGGLLGFSGMRCRLEFPNRIAPVSWWSESIPAPNFVSGQLWTFQGEWVLTPPVAMTPIDKDIISCQLWTVYGPWVLTHLSETPIDINPIDQMMEIPELQRSQAVRITRSLPLHFVDRENGPLDGWRDLRVNADQVRKLWPARRLISAATYGDVKALL